MCPSPSLPPRWSRRWSNVRVSPARRSTT
ncbi:hypothetical protein R2601_04033 [Salipiger bermudensis HTCC2601]|uniref:Uncharacterized protein n=1 Tax=Salipiger bermudensis (strain DSM 26914 / JCM 13377 / KCTC 12554 / HTCC2601) TaxID=314265 RepID=Q0FW39_SALBH|nr:hypothetical protein R2601_04033 [Salipiger bermudensis HTCC2601]